MPITLRSVKILVIQAKINSWECTVKKRLPISILILALVLTACVDNKDTEITESAVKSETQTLAPPTFKAPADWSRSDNDDVIKFTAPEGDASLTLVTLATANDALDAAQTAFKKANPKFDREVKLLTEDAASRGWTSISEIEYQTSPAEERLLYAYAHEYQGAWTVLLLDGHLGTIAKRSAAARSMLGSLARVGFESEDLAGRTAALMTPEKVELLLDFVKTSADALSVPGVGIGIIQNGEVVFSGGVGVKSVETGDAIDGDTRFMIASNTKGMTTLLLAKLVELGRLNWEDQVVQHYPDFRLGDEETTNSVLIKHLVCACTGLPRKDYEWLFNNGPDTPASSTFDELAATQPTSGFGELYQYNNQMAAAAGYVAAYILYPDMEIGAAYDRAMQEYIFDPLAMTNTTFNFADAIKDNVAEPYGVNFDSEIVAIPQSASQGFNHAVIAARPAGAAWSTTSDMLKYIQNELSAGLKADSTRLFAEGPLLERRKKTVETSATSSYGMGLSLRDISGIEIVQHGGSMAGYKSQMVIIPEANFGAVILTNSDEGGSLLSPFGRRLVEILYDGEEKAEATISASVTSIKAYLAEERKQLTIPADPRVVSDLAKQYSSPKLGIIDIRSEEGQLILDAGTWAASLGTKINDDKTTSLVVTEGAGRGVELIVGVTDNQRTLSLITPQHSYVFTEVD